jgi:hypothetical protein
MAAQALANCRLRAVMVRWNAGSLPLAFFIYFN